VFRASAAKTTAGASLWGKSDGFDDIERLARSEAIGRQVIPFAQLLDGDAEAIGNGYERVRTGYFVTLPGRKGARCSDRYDQLIT